VRWQRSDASGSVLVEALIGIAMLALIVASLVPFNRSRSHASEAVAVRTAALDLAHWRLAREMLASTAVGATWEEDDRHGLISAVRLWDGSDAPGGACERPSSSRLRGGDVEVSEGGGDPLLALLSTRLERVRQRQAHPDVRVAGSAVRIDGNGAEGVPFILEGGTDQLVVSADASGCVVLPELAPGRYVLRPPADAVGAMLVDAAQRRADAASIVVDVFDRPVVQRWQLSTGVELTIDIEDAAARLPDVVRFGELTWMIRGDDDRSTVQLGSTRLVHPGPMTVVVSPCANPDAFGSTSDLSLDAGGAQRVVVPLAKVSLQGLIGREDDAIYALRATDCFDGSGVRPALRWEGGLHEGMRIALPHGEWEARVETLSGVRISAPVHIAAGDDDASVVFP
jgi:hypothetical protein